MENQTIFIKCLLKFDLHCLTNSFWVISNFDVGHKRVIWTNNNMDAEV